MERPCVRTANQYQHHAQLSVAATRTENLALIARLNKIDLKLSGFQDLVASNFTFGEPAGSAALASRHAEHHMQHKRGPPGAKASRRVAEPADIAESSRQDLIISELRLQLAAKAAAAVRREEVQQHGRLLKSLCLSPASTDQQCSIAELFVFFSGSSSEVTVSEPYLVSVWQVRNFEALAEALLVKWHVRLLRLTTYARSRSQADALSLRSFR